MSMLAINNMVENLIINIIVLKSVNSRSIYYIINVFRWGESNAMVL